MIQRLGLVLLLASCATAPQQPVTAIVGASLVDGSGGPAIPNATVIVRGDHIESVGSATIPRGATTIDAHGLTLAPGFIDMHNHSGSGLNDDPSATTQVSQGITTLLVGQDGGSELPIGAYLDKLDRNPVAVNVATFVGQSTVREKIMGGTDRVATADEISKMTLLVDQAMRRPLRSGIALADTRRRDSQDDVTSRGAAAAPRSRTREGGDEGRSRPLRCLARHRPLDISAAGADRRRNRARLRERRRGLARTRRYRREAGTPITYSERSRSNPVATRPFANPRSKPSRVFSRDAIATRSGVS